MNANARITIRNWLISISVIGSCIGGYALYQLLDGPSAAEVEQAQADDLLDAQLAARRGYRDCRKFIGPASNPVRSAGTHQRACHEADIEHAPEDAANRYALLQEGEE